MRYIGFGMSVLAIALAGGGLGGPLIAIPASILDWWHGHYDNFYATISIGTMLGAMIGCMPATVCGLALAWGRSTRSWENVGFAAMVGGVASVLFTWLWAPDGVVVLCSLVGVLAAAILAALVLPKAQKPSDKAA